MHFFSRSPHCSNTLVLESWFIFFPSLLGHTLELVVPERQCFFTSKLLIHCGEKSISQTHYLFPVLSLLVTCGLEESLTIIN